jgi:hypothetical protein
MGTPFTIQNDDGSSTVYDGTDTYATNTEGVAVSRVGDDGSYEQSATYLADAREAEKLTQFYPQAPTSPGAANAPWWEWAAKVGITRAIDAHFGPKASDKSTEGASYAGQNGQTYKTGKVRRAPNNQDNQLMVLIVLGGLLYAIAS